MKKRGEKSVEEKREKTGGGNLSRKNGSKERKKKYRGETKIKKGNNLSWRSENKGRKGTRHENKRTKWMRNLSRGDEY